MDFNTPAMSPRSDDPSTLVSKIVLTQVVLQALAKDDEPEQHAVLLELLCLVASGPSSGIDLAQLLDYRAVVHALLSSWNTEYADALEWPGQHGSQSALGTAKTSPSSIDRVCDESLQLFRNTECFFDFDLEAALFAREAEKGIIQYPRQVLWQSLPGYTFLTWFRLPTAATINQLLVDVRSHPRGYNLRTQPSLVRLAPGLDIFATLSPDQPFYIKFCLLHILSKDRPAELNRSPGLRISLLRRFNKRSWTVGKATLLLIEADDASLKPQGTIDRRNASGATIRTLQFLYELGSLDDDRWHHLGVSHASPLTQSKVANDASGDVIPPAAQVYVDGSRVVDNQGAYLVSHLKKLTPLFGSQRVQLLRKHQQSMAHFSQVYPTFTNCNLSKCYVGMHFAGQLQFPALMGGVLSHETIFGLFDEGPNSFAYGSGETKFESATAPVLQESANSGMDTDDSAPGLSDPPAATSSLTCRLPRRSHILFPSPSSPEIHITPTPLPTLAQAARDKVGRESLFSRAVASVSNRFMTDSSVTVDEQGEPRYAATFHGGINRPPILFCYDAACTRAAAAGTTTLSEMSTRRRMDDHDRPVRAWTPDVQEYGTRLENGVLAFANMANSHPLTLLLPCVCGAIDIVTPVPPITCEGSQVESTTTVSGPMAILEAGGFAAILPLLWPLGSPIHTADLTGNALRSPVRSLQNFLRLTRLLLQSGMALRNNFSRCGGFELFGWLLRRIPKQIFTKHCLLEIVQLTEWLIQRKKHYCKDVYRHTDAAAAAAAEFSVAASQSSASEGGGMSAVEDALDRLDPIFEQSRRNQYCELCLCLFHYVLLDFEIWAECLSCDLQIWLLGYVGGVLLADEVRFVHRDLKGIFRTISALRMHFKRLESCSKLTAEEISQQTEIGVKLVHIVEIFALTQGRVICTDQEIAIIAHLALQLAESSSNTTAAGNSTNIVLHECLSGLLELLLSVVRNNAQIYARALGHQEFNLAITVIANSRHLPAPVVLAAVRLQSILTLHFIAPGHVLRLDRVPPFLQSDVRRLFEVEKRLQQVNSRISSSPFFETDHISTGRLVRQALASKMLGAFASCDFPKAFLTAAAEDDSKYCSDYPTSCSSLNNSKISDAEAANQQLLSLLFAMLEGDKLKVRDPDDNIEMTPIRFPEVLDVIAHICPSLSDAHFKQVLIRIDLLCKNSESALAIVGAGGPGNRQWWQGWLSVMILEAISRRLRTYRASHKVEVQPGGRTNDETAEPSSSDRIENVLLHSVAMKEDVTLVLCYSLCGALLKELLFTTDGWTVWLGAGAWLRFISRCMETHLGLNRTRCLRLLQCELLSATLSRFAKDVHFQSHSIPASTRSRSASNVDIKSSIDETTYFCAPISKTMLDVGALRQNLYLTLHFIAESLLPPRKTWQMAGQRCDRCLSPSFEALVSCVASLNNLKSKLDLYQPGLRSDVKRRLSELRTGSLHEDSAHSTRGSAAVVVGDFVGALGTSPADLIALILARCLPLCTSPKPIEQALQFLLEYAQHVIMTVGDREAESGTDKLGARARTGSSSHVSPAREQRNSKFVFSHSEFMVLMIIRSIKMFIQMRPSSASAPGSDKSIEFGATVVLIISAKYPWHEAQLCRDLRSLGANSQSTVEGGNTDILQTTASCFEALRDFLCLFEAEYDHIEKLNVPFFATIAAGLRRGYENDGEADSDKTADVQDESATDSQVLLLPSLRAFDWESLFPAIAPAARHDGMLTTPADQVLGGADIDVSALASDVSLLVLTDDAPTTVKHNNTDTLTESEPDNDEQLPTEFDDEQGDISLIEDFENVAKHDILDAQTYGNRGSLLWSTLHKQWRQYWRQIYSFRSPSSVEALIQQQRSSVNNGSAAPGLYFSQIGLPCEIGFANEHTVALDNSSEVRDPETFELQSLEDKTGCRRSYVRSNVDQRYFLSFQASVHHESILESDGIALPSNSALSPIAKDADSLRKFQHLLLSQQVLKQNTLLPHPQLQIDEPLPSMGELRQSSNRLKLLPSRMITVTMDVQGTFAVTTQAIYFQPNMEQRDIDGDNWVDDQPTASHETGPKRKPRSSGSRTGAIVHDVLKARSNFVAAREKWRHQACRRWPLSTIQRVLLRRFRQQDCAFEIFVTGAGVSGGDDGVSGTSSSFFFTFGSRDERDSTLEVLGRCCAAVHSSLSLQTPVVIHSPSLAKQSRLLLDPAVTQDWMDRKISNFDYLMLLNQAAGRSNNDISQYFVFPWILRDYSAPEVKLAAAKTYRNLGKPVGALHHSRLQEFRKRYRSWNDPSIPPFMYGSHYSTAVGTVLFFLVRMLPHAHVHCAYQSQHFDVTDRLFSSIEETWRMNLTSVSEVKELVPEFYYNPEFLRNRNGFDFGRTQDGAAVGDVILPAWARGSPEEFVTIHRQALESEFVSQHLHHWIDLIFGHKQSGEAAKRADNVFFHLTHYGQVNLDEISDDTMRKATELQIAHFGQCPIQIFDQAHPPRGLHNYLDGPKPGTANTSFSREVGGDRRSRSRARSSSRSESRARSRTRSSSGTSSDLLAGSRKVAGVLRADGRVWHDFSQANHHHRTLAEYIKQFRSEAVDGPSDGCLLSQPDVSEAWVAQLAPFEGHPDEHRNGEDFWVEFELVGGEDPFVQPPTRSSPMKDTPARDEDSADANRPPATKGASARPCVVERGGTSQPVEGGVWLPHADIDQELYLGGSGKGALNISNTDPDSTMHGYKLRDVLDGRGKVRCRELVFQRGARPTLCIDFGKPVTATEVTLRSAAFKRIDCVTKLKSDAELLKRRAHAVAVSRIFMETATSEGTKNSAHGIDSTSSKNTPTRPASSRGITQAPITTDGGSPAATAQHSGQDNDEPAITSSDTSTNSDFVTPQGSKSKPETDEAANDAGRGNGGGAEGTPSTMDATNRQSSPRTPKPKIAKTTEYELATIDGYGGIKRFSLQVLKSPFRMKPATTADEVHAHYHSSDNSTWHTVLRGEFPRTTSGRSNRTFQFNGGQVDENGDAEHVARSRLWRFVIHSVWVAPPRSERSGHRSQSRPRSVGHSKPVTPQASHKTMSETATDPIRDQASSSAHRKRRESIKLDDASHFSPAIRESVKRYFDIHGLRDRVAGLTIVNFANNINSKSRDPPHASYAQQCKISTERAEAQSTIVQLCQNEDGILLGVEKTGQVSFFSCSWLGSELQKSKSSGTDTNTATVDTESQPIAKELSPPDVSLQIQKVTQLIRTGVAKQPHRPVAMRLPTFVHTDSGSSTGMSSLLRLHVCRDIGIASRITIMSSAGGGGFIIAFVRELDHRLHIAWMTTEPLKQSILRQHNLVTQQSVAGNAQEPASRTDSRYAKGDSDKIPIVGQQRFFTAEQPNLWIAAVRGHQAPITCVAGDAGTTLVSGSSDGVLLGWRLLYRKNAAGAANRRQPSVSEKPAVVFQGHCGPIVAISVCMQVGLVASVSKVAVNGVLCDTASFLVMVHSLATGALVFQFSDSAPQHNGGNQQRHCSENETFAVYNPHTTPRPLLSWVHGPEDCIVVALPPADVAEVHHDDGESFVRRVSGERVAGRLLAFSCSGKLVSLQETGTVALTALSGCVGRTSWVVTGDENGCVYLRSLRAGDIALAATERTDVQTTHRPVSVLDGGLRKASIISLATSCDGDGVLFVGDCAGLVRAIQLPHVVHLPPRAHRDRAASSVYAKMQGGSGGSRGGGNGEKIKKLASKGVRNVANAGMSLFKSFKNWYQS